VTRPLTSLFAPRSVAIVGASADETKWGNRFALKALRGAHRRAVYFVNRRGGEILGRPAYDSLAAVPEPPELVVVCVPPAAFGETVDAALAAGARAVVGISAGVGADEERAVAARVRDAGAVLLGPNCLGVFDAESELDLAPWGEFPHGEIGLLSQSGNLALEIGLLAQRVHVGFSRFASLGDQADLDVSELVAELAAHERTRVIALYVEDFRDGRAFVERAREAGKPVVLLAAGVSRAGSRAALSHTGALVTDAAVIEAACRAAGIVQVGSPRELVDAASALLGGRRIRGRRIAVLADGGGHGVVAADVLDRHGFELPSLSPGLARTLAATLPPTAATANPVDLAGAGEHDVSTFAHVAELLAESGEVDALLLTGFFGGYGTDAERAAAAEIARVAVPVVVHTLYPESEAASDLVDGGAIVHAEIEAAVRAAAALATAVPTPPSGCPLRKTEIVRDGYFGARDLVAAAGIALAAARFAATLDEARAAAREIGYPIVLKNLAREHKSDGGGVVLGLADEAALELAFGAAGDYSVERMVDARDGVELIAGVRRDARFGHVLLVGAGGIHAETLADAAMALAPVDAEAAERLLRSLRIAPLLDGARGRPAVDVGAAARAAAALSELDVDVEINPLLVTPRGALALDARVTAESPAPRA
jgi:acetate---CoA ligase (ADP-forming)